jgi:hypothetical protein
MAKRNNPLQIKFIPNIYTFTELTIPTDVYSPSQYAPTILVYQVDLIFF